MKKILEEKINQQKIYENILEKQIKPHQQKWILLPISLILIGCLTFYPDNTEKVLQEENQNKVTSEEKNNSNDTETDGFPIEEEQKNFTDSNTYSSLEDTINRYVDTEENLDFPFSTNSLPKELKLIKTQKVYKQEKYIGIRKIYETTDSYKQWEIIYYLDRKMEEKEELPIINNRKYHISEKNAHILVAFNYNDLQVDLWAINTLKEEVLDFLKTI